MLLMMSFGPFAARSARTHRALAEHMSTSFLHKAASAQGIEAAFEAAIEAGDAAVMKLVQAD